MHRIPGGHLLNTSALFDGGVLENTERNNIDTEKKNTLCFFFLCLCYLAMYSPVDRE